MIPSRDCHWNLLNLVDSSSSLLAHILFCLIDCHNLFMVLGMPHDLFRQNVRLTGLILGQNQPELPERFLETTPGTGGNGL